MDFKLFSFLFALVVLYSTSIDGNNDMEWYHLRVAGPRPASREGGAYFTRKTGDIILFGGFAEENAVNTGPNVFYNDLYSLDVTTNSSCSAPNTPGCNANTDFYTWRIVNNGSGIAPEKRALFCWAYNSGEDSLYIFGGVNYTNTFTSFTFFNDTWKFSFASSQWTRLFPTGKVPSARGGTSCARIGGDMYLFGGSNINFQTFVSVAYSDLYKYNFAGNSWSFIGSKNTSAGNPWPGERLQFNFLRIPRTKTIFLTDGFREDPQTGKSIPYNDVWIYDSVENKWKNLQNTGTPKIVREYMGAVALSNRYVLFQGGDAQGNRTAADLCKLPLRCFIASSPTDNTFIYDIQQEKFTELFLDRLLPPLKRLQLTLTADNQVFEFGGSNFYGTEGVGTLRDRHTWALEVNNHYLRDIRSDDDDD